MAGLLGAGWLSAAGALLAQTASEPPVQLPKYVVTGERVFPPAESWRYTQIDGFEVLSNASDSEAGPILRNFERFRLALAIAWPPANLGAHAPNTLILCGKGGKFDAFSPSGKGGGEQITRSLSGPDHGAIVVDVEAKTMNIASTEAIAASGMVAATAGDGGYAASRSLADSMTGTGATAQINSGSLTAPGGDGGPDPLAGNVPHLSIDTNHQLYREYVHFVFSRAQPPPPPWLEEGLAEVLMRIKVEGDRITLGNLEDVNVVSAIAGMIEETDFNRELVHQHLMPLKELFAVPASSPLAQQPMGSLWAHECYAFVHYGLFGEKNHNRPAFLRFIARASTEPVTEALFKECFGVSYTGMEIRLRGYINYTTYTSSVLQTHDKKPLPEPAKPVFRDATEGEIARLKGEALVMAGKPDMAYSLQQAAYYRGDHTPELLASLGLDELSRGDPARAEPLLQAAVSGHVARPQAYLALAQLRLKAALAHPDPNGKLSPPQVATILRPLFAGRTVQPRSPEIYDLIIDTWTHSAVPPTQANLSVVNEGLRFFYRDPGMVMAAANLEMKSGMKQSAAELVEVGLRVAPDAQTKAQFAQMKDGLEHAAP